MLSAAERAALMAVPDTEEDLIRRYTFSEADLSVLVEYFPDSRVFWRGAV
jgi:hypothetical protein